jgi:hypothetical protein
VADRAVLAGRIRGDVDFEEFVFALLLAGAVTWQDAWQPPDLVELFRERFSEVELESMPRALGSKHRAHPDELLALGVSGLTCEGEDLQSIALAELVGRMKAAQRLRKLRRPSTWLNPYVARLVAESKRRKGIVEANR